MNPAAHPAPRAPLGSAWMLGMLLLPAAGSVWGAPGISGKWDAAVEVESLHVPFPFEISVHGDAATGWFFNGKERVISSSGSFENGHLRLEFPTYARRLEATLAPDGTLSGAYLPTTPKATASPYAFQARPAQPPPADPHPPRISGQWLIPTDRGKQGEKAWRFLVRQSGARVSAVMLRVDGDGGQLTGTWQGGRLLLSHFDGARPSVLEVSPAEDGTLKVLVHDRHGKDKDLSLTAYRADTAQARGLPSAADPAQHTRMKDPNEPFRFSFPDLQGHLVSNTDSRFQGKVLVLDIGGSWCPNCHDEAPFLEELYRKYHRQGLEIVTLSFEEAEQLVNPTRLRAFIEHYHIHYTVLVAGTTDELHDKVPQAQGLDAYPTTFFIGRDGRVRAVHAGFAAATTGEFNRRLRQDFTQTIEQLLAEKVPQRHPPS